MKSKLLKLLIGILSGALITIGASATCTHSYVSNVETPAKALTAGVMKYTCSACGDTYTEEIPATRKLKILAIGNSFSVDAMEYLWNIANDGGVSEIVLGNLYIGGCSIATHAKNIDGELASYTYYKNTSGTWNKTESVSVQTALADEEWDIITVQQASNYSGMPSSYEKLAGILNFLAQNKPNAKVYFHMTWAYQANSTHSGFANYNKNQMTMYQAIQSTLDTEVKTKDSIVGIIPSGTAIQNLRSSYIGDTVTRDGYHLSYDLGRYTAALTWYTYFTGAAADTVDWVPTNYSSTVTKHFAAIREAVTGAIATPYSITTVKATEPGTVSDADVFASLGYNMNSYTKADWALAIHAYYSSASSTTPFDLISSANSSATNLKNFIASHRYTRETLPVGSILILDEGYKYRPEGWIDENYSCSSSERPALTNESVVVVTEEWWGDFNYRAFNLTTSPAKTMEASDIKHFRIYIPKHPNITLVNTADTNGDGTVDIKDALVTVKTLLNDCGIGSDVNNDGLVNLKDVLSILRQISK